MENWTLEELERFCAGNIMMEGLLRGEPLYDLVKQVIMHSISWSGQQNQKNVKNKVKK